MSHAVSRLWCLSLALFTWTLFILTDSQHVPGQHQVLIVNNQIAKELTIGQTEVKSYYFDGAICSGSFGTNNYQTAFIKNDSFLLPSTCQDNSLKVCTLGKENGVPTIITSHEFSAGENCFSFFSVPHQSYFGGLCISKSSLGETELLLYQILYNGPMSYASPLGISAYIDLDNSLPIVIGRNDVEQPIIMYTTYIRHLNVYKLVIIDFSLETRAYKEIPSDCSKPNKMITNGKNDAVITCSNGNVYYFNGMESTLTNMRYYGITMLTSCANVNSFVMIQSSQYLLFNNTGTMHVIALHQIQFNSQAIGKLLSIACSYNGKATEIYFTVTTNNVLHHLVVELETAESNMLVSSKEFIPAQPYDNRQTIYSTVEDGSVLITRLVDTSRGTQVMILVDLETKQWSSTSEPVSALVLLWSKNTTLQKSVIGKENEDYKGSKVPWPIVAVGIISIVVIITIVIIAVFVVRNRYTKARRYQILPTESLISMTPTQFSESSFCTVDPPPPTTTSFIVPQVTDDNGQQIRESSGGHVMPDFISSDQVVSAGITSGTDSRQTSTGLDQGDNCCNTSGQAINDPASYNQAGNGDCIIEQPSEAGPPVDDDHKHRSPSHSADDEHLLLISADPANDYSNDGHPSASCAAHGSRESVASLPTTMQPILASASATSQPADDAFVPGISEHLYHKYPSKQGIDKI